MDDTVLALADPTRRELLRRIARKPRRAGELARGFAMSRPAVCKHARVLKNAGLVTSKRNGREQIYELAPNGAKAVRELIATLEEVSRLWDVALDAFKRHLERSGGSE
ncbi:MAG TPA: metalloregulator ArsR/SmtB family transcription factor [Candidatus Binataceae bacterium]|nr:metalloregulator ArsR/SmtB family transcription factor [Candidatus Binataceae bacterium]